MIPYGMYDWHDRRLMGWDKAFYDLADLRLRKLYEFSIEKLEVLWYSLFYRYDRSGCARLAF